MVCNVECYVLLFTVNRSGARCFVTYKGGRKVKPGGNFTQPHYDPITEQYSYEVYVGWCLIARVDNDAEATYLLRSTLADEAVKVAAFDVTPA
jgi:hypothetical protein